MHFKEDLLNEFCRSIDAMDEQSFDKFRSLALLVLRSEFQTLHSDIKLDGRRADGAPALDTMRLDPYPKQYNLVPVKYKDGKYSSQRAFSYDLGCPLWISTRCGNAITKAKSTDVVIEPWGGFEGDFTELRKRLPKYEDFDKEQEGGAKTSVIVPLRYGANRPRVFGVLCLEFKQSVERLPHTVSRISTIARAIAKAIWIFETTREQRQGTINALNALERRVNEQPRGPGLSKPTVFFAFPSKGDPAVREMILDAVGRWPDTVHLQDWSEMNEPGPISTEITKGIASASFGICYFSEPCPDGSKYPYRDNPNVLIEAGMMNSAFHSASEGTSRWLLVRESHEANASLSCDPPFDIQAQRFLIVPRRPGKSAKAAPVVDARAFRDALLGHLEKVFGCPPAPAG